MRGCRLWIIALALCGATSAAQTISFTFDDGLDPRTEPNAARWNAQILAALHAAGVQAMLFPAGKNVDSSAGMALVQDWARAGHAIGNHSYLHRNYASPAMTAGEFAYDVLRADRLLNALPTWQKRLRFPYLKEGESRVKVDAMRRWMADNGYRPGPVSIDTSDWYYAMRLEASRHPQAAERVQRLYLRHMLDRARYYDDLARKALGRSPAHVMLLHVNAVNAAFLGSLLEAFAQQGWKIVAPMMAFEDPIYRLQPAALPAGESIVWALAKEAGIEGLRYPAEDDIYERAALDAEGL